MALSTTVFLLLVSISLIPPCQATKGEQTNKLRIAMVAPLFEAVPPLEYRNGDVGVKTAQMVHKLTEELVRRGHEVTLFAPEGSRTSAKLISIFGPTGQNRGAWCYHLLWMLEQLRRRAGDFDLVHFHMFEHFPHVGPFIGKSLTTLHEQPGGGTIEDMRPIAEMFPHAPICVDPQHLNAAKQVWQNVVDTVSVDMLSTRLLADAYEQIYEKVMKNAKITQQKHGQIYRFDQHTAEQRKVAQCARLSQNGPLRIATLSPPPYNALPVIKAGGTERMIYLINEGMVKRGHQVTLFAAIGSKTSGKLIEYPYTTNPRPKSDDNYVHYMLQTVISQALVRLHAHEFDMLHFHDIDSFVLIQNDYRNQALMTRHLPFGDYPWDVNFYSVFNRVPMVSVSEFQRSTVPTHRGQHMDWIANVHNGIEVDKLRFVPVSRARQPYLAWLGRMVPEKGIDVAIEFALQAGMALKIAAQMIPDCQGWWDREIQPLMDKHPDQLEYVGEINDQQKVDFIGNAVAMLFTPKWDEPFGLSLVEAMATGTPVIANRRAAVPELIEEGITGFSFPYDDKKEDQRAEQIRQANPRDLVGKAAKLDRKLVRQKAEQKWSADRMAREYEEVYRQHLAKMCQ